MSSLDSDAPTRLVLCVDGTDYSPTGASKSSTGQPNVHRIFASIKCGVCEDGFKQIPKYFPGIGAADNAFSTDRLQASVTGQGYVKQIQEVYEACSELSGEKDEVWLFGFSRGAYVVRAVAGLLNSFGALASAGSLDYGKDFKRLLKEAQGSDRSSFALSPVTTISSSHTKPPPRIQFVGVFETIKAVNEDSLFDVSFNRSIRHMRHALALHEDRKALAPEYAFPEELYGTNLRDHARSFIQAHFVGLHADIGGAAKSSGLGIYPLQWMLLEAKQCGLDIDMDSGSGNAPGMKNPISFLFPKHKKNKAFGETMWSCQAANGVVVFMDDVRAVHGTRRGGEDYAVKLNKKFGSIRQTKTREPFSKDGMLQGYCDWAPQGTIIHPSVYLLLDEHLNLSLETREIKLQRDIEDWRERMLGSDDGHMNTGFWLDDFGDANTGAVDPGAIRVLVCGNTGVGKSTLINKTFGVDLTQSSSRFRGIHDVREEITWEGRPDLIVHDSGGFEAGADDEFKAIEEFLKEKAEATDIAEKLHIIWFCIDINSARTRQTATEKLFQAVGKYAKDVPIVVVATKKDDYLDIEFGAHRKAMKKEGKRFDEDACERHAEEMLEERVELIRTEMESVEGGRLDACLAVSQDDEKSIANLTQTTSRLFDTDKVRLLYVRAQVTQINLKIDLAVAEFMRQYKALIRRTTGLAFAVGGSTINRKLSTNAVTKAIINCFGLPTVSADAAVNALKANVWDTRGTNMVLAWADFFQAFGTVGSVFVLGIPVWAITGSINAGYVVPATCRLFLIMACDLTFVLARAFKEVTFRANGQPTERDVAAAARNYAIRGYPQHVHKDIKQLVPRKNTIASYRVDNIQRGIEAIFIRYNDKLLENVDLPLQPRKTSAEFDDDASTEADSTLWTDLKEAHNFLSELEAKNSGSTTSLPELDGTKTPAELPAEPAGVSELEDTSSSSNLNVADKGTPDQPAELEGSTSLRKRFTLNRKRAELPG